MGLISSIFTWWNGATAGTYWTTWRTGTFIGEDIQGNRYYRNADASRRWVIYKGLAEPSRIPPEWHHYLHHTGDKPPTEDPPFVQPWEKPHLPNLTGTPYAYRPKGSLYSEGQRPKATGDYEAWTPD